MAALNPNATSPHVPVMLAEVLLALGPRDGELYVDGTFGAGGFTRAILEAADCRVAAIDRDPQAIAVGQELVRQSNGRLRLLEGRFAGMEALLAEAGLSDVDGVVLDIGVSSMQIDQAERGFSFMRDGPLDMRMGGQGPTAADAVNSLPQDRLANIIYVFGEEPKSRAIARPSWPQGRRRQLPRRGRWSRRSNAPPAANARKIEPIPPHALSRRFASM